MEEWVADGRLADHLDLMRPWQSPNQCEKAPPGEYAVFYERPYPERIERTFRIAALALGLIAGLVAVALVAMHPRFEEPVRNAFMAASAFAMVSGLAWGTVYATGLLLAAIVTAFRRKEYVVAWHDPPTVARHNRRTLLFFVGLFAMALWFAAMRRWL